MNKKNKRQAQKSWSSSIDLNDSESIRIDDGRKSIAYFCQKPPIRVSRELLAELKKAIKRAGGRNARLCLHNGPQALVHEMIILERKGKYYRPHKHLSKGETFHIIEGLMGVFSFDDKGDVIDACILDPAGNFMYKVKTNMYHAVMPITNLVIYHESKPGPFTGENDSIYPLWAPDGSDIKETVKYIACLRKALY